MHIFSLLKSSNHFQPQPLSLLHHDHLTLHLLYDAGASLSLMPRSCQEARRPCLCLAKTSLALIGVSDGVAGGDGGGSLAGWRTIFGS